MRQLRGDRQKTLNRVIFGEDNNCMEIYERILQNMKNCPGDISLLLSTKNIHTVILFLENLYKSGLL